MKIIAFDIKGKMAHFRKYYANNTALSYSLPPRTTITGFLAAMLGLPRDSYHEDFALDKIRIGVRIVYPIKKNFHRVNFLRIESLGDVAKENLGDFTGKGGRIQTPFEVVTGLDLREDWVTYRIYLGCFEAGKALFEKIERRLKHRHHHYNLSLGTANFSAQVCNMQVLTATELPENQFIEMMSAVPISAVAVLDTKHSNTIRLEEEMLPLEFKQNFNRELNNIHRFLFATNGLPFRAKMKCPVYQIEEKNKFVQFLFLETY
jgi:CRISPR-associated protein Cas5h